MQQFVARLRRFIDIEQDTQNQQIQEIWMKALEDRIQAGEAIAPISLEPAEPSDESFKLAILHCEENLSKFRAGSLVKLHLGNPFEYADAISCEILEDRGNKLLVQAGFRQRFEQEHIQQEWVLDRDKVDLREILHRTLNEFQESRQGYQIFRMLMGNLSPHLNQHRHMQALMSVDRFNMNIKQEEAFMHAFSTENYYLIQGPPGTGKTHLLAQLAVELAKQGENVLITAFTHRAINNALRKIAQQTGYERIIKVGQRTKADDLSWDGGEVMNIERLKEHPILEETGFIIGGTCYAVRTSRLQAMPFDTVIFDEAGQLPIPLAIAGMLAGKRYVFVGDHQQMAPVIVGEHEDREIKQSAFSFLFQHSKGTMLDTTYRMNAAINAFPSEAFYEGRLKAYPPNQEKQLHLPQVPTRFQEILAPEHPSVFVDLQHEKQAIRSVEEAELAADLVEELLLCGVSTKEIAVVAPYRAQGRMIRAMLYKRIAEQTDEIVVDTVERIQGQERDVVIISLTTSDPSYAVQRAEFYFQPNRLNVALTRPRVKRIVLGSSHLLTAQSDDPQFQAWIRLFQQFYEGCVVLK